MFRKTVALCSRMSGSPLAEFKKSGIIPDCLPVTTGNFETITLSYGDKQVNFGTELKTAVVKEAPTSITWKNDPTELYTLLMTDLDAPFRNFAFMREIKHWLVYNIPGDQISKGDTQTGYAGAGPPPLGGLHRYVFLVFRQTSRITMTPEEAVGSNSIKGRMRFKTAKMVKEKGLEGPVAGNFFQSQHGN